MKTIKHIFSLIFGNDSKSLQWSGVWTRSFRTVAHAAGSPVVCAPLPPGTAGPGKLRENFAANFGVCRRFCRFCAPHCRDKLPNLPNQAPAVYSDVTCLDFEVEWKSWNFCRWETLNMFWYVLTVFRASFKCSCIASPLVCPQTSAICQLSPDICIFETKQIELRQVRSAIFVEFVHCIDCMCGCVIGWEKMLIRWITH